MEGNGSLAVEWIRSLVEDPVFFSDGFISGLCIGVILVLLVWVVSRSVYRRRYCQGVTVPGEEGELFITMGAVRESVTRLLEEFAEASLVSVALCERNDQLCFELGLNLAPNVPVVPVADRIRKRVILEAHERMGIQSSVTVNIKIKSVSLSARAGAAGAPPALTAAPPADAVAAEPGERASVGVASDDGEDVGAATS